VFQALDGSRLGLGCWEAPGHGPSPGFLWLNILQIDGGGVLYSFEILIFYLSPHQGKRKMVIAPNYLELG